MGGAEQESIDHKVEGVLTMKQAKISTVKALPDCSVEVTWENKSVSVVCLLDVIQRHQAMAHLLDEDVFKTVAVGEWGWSIEWGNGIDIGVDRLFELAQEQNDNPYWATYHQWKVNNELTHDAAHDALGISVRMSKYYDNAERIVPKTVALACVGWEASHHT
ncbi:MAG: DUF2442 domain-containing protein [Mariprofundaceae bacterium]|nr:DUF2442 domain-containing protein [Mariprofundaceae bacterium]